jgi:starch synthase
MEPFGMTDTKQNPRILIATPEVAYLPHDMDNAADYLTARASGLADVFAALISALFEQGADVHVAIPDYRSMFNKRLPAPLRRGMRMLKSRLPQARLHLAEDRAFFYLSSVYSDYGGESRKQALVFQREIINNVIPFVQPDLIHCCNWMTGLIPAMARKRGIPCLFTFHDLQTLKCPLSLIEDRGIDAAEFWQNLYFERMPFNYEESRHSNPVDFLASGIFAAHFVSTVSPNFLMEIAGGRYSFVPEPIRQQIASKVDAGCAVGILSAPDPSYNPAGDRQLEFQFGPQNHAVGKRKNKLALQRRLNLIQDERAPLFFWPSRLDRVQKGCRLLADILYEVVARYRAENLEIVFVADGDFRSCFAEITRVHHLQRRTAVCNYNERLSRSAYAASDFILLPSSFEPCGLPPMIGPIYGSLPITHHTGGIADAIAPLNVENNTGNGFLFKPYTSQKLFEAIQQAMEFYRLPAPARQTIVKRIMTQCAATFSHEVTARRYIELYEKMLERPLISRTAGCNQQQPTA